MNAYDEIIEFIAAASPQAVSGFQSSAKTRERVAVLLEKNNAGKLTESEILELDDYMKLEHIMRLAKARARQLLAHG